MGANFAQESSLSNTETITSRDITEITGKRHDNVLKDIRNLYAKLGLHRSQHTAEWTDSNNVVRTMYALPRQLGEQLLLGYGPAIRAKVIDRLNEVGRVGSKELAALSVPSVSVSQPVSVGVTRINSPDADELTMSSVEIANLTGKRHDHVMRDIRSMLDDLAPEVPPTFGGYYKASNGKQNPCFNLPRREVDILLTGYSTTMRAAVIDRWRELEAQVAKPATVANLNDAAQLRGLLLGYTEQVMQLEHKVGAQAVKIAEDAPKVKVFTKLVDQKGVTNFQKFCTQLNLHQRKIKAWLRDIGWLRADQWEVNPLPTAKAVDAGYCDIKRFETKTGKLVQQIVFTGKAEAYVELKAPDYVRKPVRKERKKAA